MSKSLFKKTAIAVAVVGTLGSGVVMAGINASVDNVVQTVVESDLGGRSYKLIGFTDFPTDASQINLTVQDYTATNDSRVSAVFLNGANDKVTDVRNDLTINVTAQNNNNKVQDARGFTQTGNANTITTFHKNATINVSVLKGGTNAIGYGQFANALNLDNGSKVVFAGDETKLSTTHMGYTAQAVIVWNNATVEFTGNDVEINSTSDTGANGMGVSTVGGTIKFDNIGDATVNVNVTDSNSFKTNAVGYLAFSSEANLVVTDKVDQFKINVTGSGSDSANGTAGIYTGGQVDVDAQKFVINVEAGNQVGQAKSYGIRRAYA